MLRPVDIAFGLTRRTGTPLRAGIVALALGAIGSTTPALAAPVQAAAPADPAEAFLAGNRAHDKAVVETSSGLQYKILTTGEGTATPTDQDVALINYEGRLVDGTIFDKSQQPTPMPIAGVVPGFSEALKLMPKGAKIRVWIKPGLAYGDEASGPIPAHSVLIFDIELLDFLPEPVVRQMMMDAQRAQATPQQ